LHGKPTAEGNCDDLVMVMSDEQISQVIDEMLGLYHDMSITFERSKE
jgi:hypothetical protein